ncbi:MAG: hypothetical protein JW860_02380, partial [Sedimentisphaerales bacterium]|nr:hypothetical protein [Sedimentisphaerales bacterium]
MSTYYTPLIDATMEIKLETAQAHLLLEEIMRGESPADIKEVWELLDAAEWYAQAVLNGNTNSKGTFLPLTNNNMREQIKVISKKLKEFRIITQHRFEASKQSIINSELDQKFHSLFIEIINQSDQVETGLQKMTAHNLRLFRTVKIVLITLCVCFFIVVGLITNSFMRRRVRDQLELQAANQQLAAGNQQLQAGQQQLKALNQQL